LTDESPNGIFRILRRLLPSIHLAARLNTRSTFRYLGSGHWLTLGLIVLFAAACAPSGQLGKVPPGAAQEAGSSVLKSYLEQRERETMADMGGVYRPYVAVFPFRDDSGFPDDFWDLESDIARLLAAEMAVQRFWHVVPYDAVVEVATEPLGVEQEELYEAARLLGADIVLLGTLLDFNMERFTVGDPLLGGYKSYRGTAEVELKAVRAEDRSTVGNLYSKIETTDRGLGIDLLGKPREQDQQFVNLRNMAFGSEEFRATGLGQATLEVLGELVEKLVATLKPRGITLAEGAFAEVLSVNGEEVFINIGSENGVYVGQRLSIVPAPERALTQSLAGDTPVSVVQVQDVIGGRVSRARALYGAALVVTGDHLRPIEADLP
jgi:hypothetical protein